MTLSPIQAPQEVNQPVITRKKGPKGDLRKRILVLTANRFKQNEFKQELATGYGANVTFIDPPERVDDVFIREILAKQDPIPHYIIREESKLYDALRNEELNGLDLIEQPEKAPPFIKSTATMHVWEPIWDDQSQLVKIGNSKFFHLIKGSFDPTKKELRKPEVFGWDHLFVNSVTDLTHTESIQKGYGKMAPRQHVISDFVTRYLFYVTPQSLTYHPELKPKKAIEFTSEMSVTKFFKGNQLLSNPNISRWGLDEIRGRIFDEGVFFKAATCRPVKNYFSPPFAGIPLTPKKSDVEETVFMMHDLNHHNIPDLIFDGDDSKEMRNVYFVWRMMSEAMTLVIADMLYGNTLALTNPDHSKKLDSRIYPLFEALNIDSPNDDNRWDLIKKLLWANTQYAILGDDSEWRNLLKPGCEEKLKAYTDHFEKFFVGDHVWTAANFKNMSAKKESYQFWIEGIGKEHFRRANLILLSDMVEKLKKRGTDLLSINAVVLSVFDEIFETRIHPKRVSQTKVDEEERLSRGFMRYMIGQMFFYSQYRYHPQIKDRASKMAEIIKNTKFFDAEKRKELQKEYESDVRSLWGMDLITTEAANNSMQLHPIFSPVYINYGKQECKTVKDVLKKLYCEILVNTSNPGKLEEYKEYFNEYSAVLDNTLDIIEPDTEDPMEIARYKASQFDKSVIVDDVSLDVEGADIGTKIRWHIDKLDTHVGKKCTYVCRLAVRVEDVVKVYIGSVEGQLVKPRGGCFGFGRYFLADGATKTLGEEMAPQFNARYLAIEKYKKDQPDKTLPPLETWKGSFQDKEA